MLLVKLNYLANAKWPRGHFKSIFIHGGKKD